VDEPRARPGAPLEFIPLLEETGLIFLEVGGWALERPCVTTCTGSSKG